MRHGSGAATKPGMSAANAASSAAAAAASSRSSAATSSSVAPASSSSSASSTAAASSSSLSNSSSSVSASSSSSASSKSSSSSASSVPNYGRQLRAWFLSLTKHERSCMLVLEDSKTVHTLLSMFGRVQEKGDGYFYGGEEVLDRISESSGRQHHLRHHHGSSLLCTAGLEADCSFCGCNSAARDVDVLAWLTDDEGGGAATASRRQSAGGAGGTAGKSQRHRSSSGSGGSSSTQQTSGRRGSTSSLLSGLNLADPFSMFGSSVSSSSSGGGGNSSSSSSEASSFMFSSRRKVNAFYHSPPELWASEQQLERSVRLCDTRGYCDTLCVMSELLEDGSSFLSLLDRISKQGFLSTPCYTTWDPRAKVWLWDVTAWFRKRGYYSLGTYLANKLEMVLWMRFWEHSGQDPRKVPSGKMYVAGGLVRERLSSKSPLAHFWSSLQAERREKIITKLVMLVDSHANSLQQQYLNLTQSHQQQQTQSSTTQQAPFLSVEEDDGGGDDSASSTAGNSVRSSSEAGTPTSSSRARPMPVAVVGSGSVMVVRSSSAASSSSSTRHKHAASSSSVLEPDSADSATNSQQLVTRTRSHSLPRRRGPPSSSDATVESGSLVHNSSGALTAHIPTSPSTPSSTNSAPAAATAPSSTLRRPGHSHGHGGGHGSGGSGISRPGALTGAQSSAGAGSSSSALPSFHSPWSSMQSSFASSLTTSPSASPRTGPLAASGAALSFNLQHHIASPQAGQLTPNLALTHPRQLRSPLVGSSAGATGSVAFNNSSSGTLVRPSSAGAGSSSSSSSSSTGGSSSASSRAAAAALLASLPKFTPFERAKDSKTGGGGGGGGLSSELIRSLLATAEAHELKASLQNERHVRNMGLKGSAALLVAAQQREQQQANEADAAATAAAAAASSASNATSSSGTPVVSSPAVATPSGAPSSALVLPLPKEKADKLRELDYDFTMCGLQLLSHLLSSLTVHNKRKVNAIPRTRMALRANNNNVQQSEQQPHQQEQQQQNVASPPFTWLPDPATTVPAVAEGIPLDSSDDAFVPEDAAAAAAVMDANADPTDAVSDVAAVGSDECALAPLSIPAPARSQSATVPSSSSLMTSSAAAMSTTTTTMPSSELSDAVVDSGADGADVASTAAAADDESTHHSDTSSAIESVVGLNLSELLLFAERSAASKSLALTAARIESLRSSWPSSRDVDDWRFIELLFSSPLARAHTNLDKIIRRIGLLLQGCYAEQIGVDLIMGEESEEQTSGAGANASSASASSAAGGGGKKAKKKAKKKVKKAAKKSSETDKGAVGDEDEDGDGDAATAEAADEDDTASGSVLATDAAAAEATKDASSATLSESLPAEGEGPRARNDDEATTSESGAARAAVADKRPERSLSASGGAPVRPSSASNKSAQQQQRTQRVRTSTSISPSRSASAEPPRSAVVTTTGTSVSATASIASTHLARARSGSAASSTLAHNPPSTVEDSSNSVDDEPWQRVQGRKSSHSLAGSKSFSMQHSSSSSSHPASARHGTPVRARAKDDSYAEQRQLQSSGSLALHTPPPSGARRAFLTAASSAPKGSAPWHAALFSSSNASSSAHASPSPSNSVVTAATAPGTASAGANSPHFNGSISFPSFNARPSSWCAAVAGVPVTNMRHNSLGGGPPGVSGGGGSHSSSIRSMAGCSSTSTSASLSPASTPGQRTPTTSAWGQPHNNNHFSLRAKDDSFAHSNTNKNKHSNAAPTERRASGALLLLDSQSGRRGEHQQHAFSAGVYAYAASAVGSPASSAANVLQQQQQHARNLSAGSVPTLQPLLTPAAVGFRSDDSSRSLSVNSTSGSANSGGGSSGASRSPLIKSSTASPMFLLPHATSPLLPTPTPMSLSALSSPSASSSTSVSGGTGATAASSTPSSGSSGTPASASSSSSSSSSFGRSSSLHLAKPVPIHSGGWHGHHGLGPSSVGLSFSSVPAHQTGSILGGPGGVGSPSYGTSGRGGGSAGGNYGGGRVARHWHDASYVHGTDDVTLQAWQRKHEANSAAAAHRRQQQLIKQQALPAVQHLLPPPTHSRVPRPSSARRIALENVPSSDTATAAHGTTAGQGPAPAAQTPPPSNTGSAASSSGSASGFGSGAASVGNRPRSNSVGEDSVRRSPSSSNASDALLDVSAAQAKRLAQSGVMLSPKRATRQQQKQQQQPQQVVQPQPQQAAEISQADVAVVPSPVPTAQQHQHHSVSAPPLMLPANAVDAASASQTALLSPPLTTGVSMTLQQQPSQQQPISVAVRERPGLPIADKPAPSAASVSSRPRAASTAAPLSLQTSSSSSSMVSSASSSSTSPPTSAAAAAAAGEQNTGSSGVNAAAASSSAGAPTASSLANMGSARWQDSVVVVGPSSASSMALSTSSASPPPVASSSASPSLSAATTSSSSGSSASAAVAAAAGAVANPVYHASVQTAQAYHKRNGMQFPPWLNASNLQLLAFIHNTGLTPPHTRSPSGSPMQSPLQGGNGASSYATSSPAACNSPLVGPMSMPLHRSLSSGHQSGSANGNGTGGSTTPAEGGESRRPSITSLMPNFLHMPNINTQQAQLLSSPRMTAQYAGGSGSHGPGGVSAVAAASSILAAATVTSAWEQRDGVPAHAQFIRVLPHPSSTSLYASASPPTTSSYTTSSRAGFPATNGALTPVSAAQQQQQQAASSSSSPPAPYAPSLPGGGYSALSFVEYGGGGGGGSGWTLRDSWKLHEEICVFAAYVADVTATRQPILLRMMGLIRECVSSLWPAAVLDCYGSFMTGLCLPTSDLDLVITGLPREVAPSAALGALANVLRKQKSWLLSLNAISTAKVPVIKLLGNLEGEEIIIDITFAASTAGATTAPDGPATGGDAAAATAAAGGASIAHTGVASVALIKEYLRVFPALRPLSLVLKQFLFERGLSNTYTGGLNSYCLVLMIVGFLQSRPQPYHAFRVAQAAALGLHAVPHAAHQQALLHVMSPSPPAGGNGSSPSPNPRMYEGNGHATLATHSSGYVPVRIRAQLMSQMASPPPYSPLAATMSAAARRQQVAQSQQAGGGGGGGGALSSTSSSSSLATSPSSVQAAVQRIEEQERRERALQELVSPRRGGIPSSLANSSGSNPSSSSSTPTAATSTLGLPFSKRLQQLGAGGAGGGGGGVGSIGSPAQSPSPSLPSMPSSPLQQSVAATASGVAYRFPSPALPPAAMGAAASSSTSSSGSPSPSSAGSSVSSSTSNNANGNGNGNGPPLRENLGALLVDFLRFYGCHFDFGAMALAVHLPPGHTPVTAVPTASSSSPPAPTSASSASAAGAAPSSNPNAAGSPPSQQQQSSSSPPVVGGGPPGAPGMGPPPLSLQLPVRTFNYLSIMHPTAHNLHFPLSSSSAEAARRHASPQAEEDAWGHGVFLLLSQVSRVLVISDPLYPLLEQNIGRSVFAMWRIKAAFDEGYRMLAAKFSPHGTAPTLLARIIQKMQQHHKKPTNAAQSDAGAAAAAAAAGGGGGGGAAGASTSENGSSGGSTPRNATSASVVPSTAGGNPSSSSSSSSSSSVIPTAPPAPLYTAPPPATPVRGLFHITLPSFFAKSDKIVGNNPAASTDP